MTLVTAVVPAYNASRFIQATIASLLAQTHDELEIIVVDDGSEDDTRSVIHCKFPQVRLITKRNAGVAAARNAGILAASGDYIAAVDADDIWQPTAARQLAACLDHSSPDVAVAYAWSTYIDQTGQPISGFCASPIEGQVWGTLLCHNFLGNASATMIRKSCLEQVGFYDPGYRDHAAQGCEDWDLYLRLAELYEFRVVPEFLIGYRKLPESMSMGNPATMARSHELLMERTKLKHPRMRQFAISFSAGSYYLHLSSACRRNGSFREAVRWSRRALVRGHVFVLLRPDFYTRLLLSWLRVPIREHNRRSSAGELKNSARLRLKFFMQQLLYRLITLCGAQTPRQKASAEGLPARHPGAQRWDSQKT